MRLVCVKIDFYLLNESTDSVSEKWKCERFLSRQNCQTSTDILMTMHVESATTFSKMWSYLFVFTNSLSQLNRFFNMKGQDWHLSIYLDSEESFSHVERYVYHLSVSWRTKIKCHRVVQYIKENSRNSKRTKEKKKHKKYFLLSSFGHITT